MYILIFLLTLLCTHNLQASRVGVAASAATHALAHHPSVLPSVLPDAYDEATTAFAAINTDIKSIDQLLEGPLSARAQAVTHRFLRFYADMTPATLARFDKQAALAQRLALSRLTKRIHLIAERERDEYSQACLNKMLATNLRLMPWLSPELFPAVSSFSRSFSGGTQSLYHGPTSRIPRTIAAVGIFTSMLGLMGLRYAIAGKNKKSLKKADDAGNALLTEVDGLRKNRIPDYPSDALARSKQPPTHLLRAHALLVQQHELRYPTYYLTDEEAATIKAARPNERFVILSKLARFQRWSKLYCTVEPPHHVTAVKPPKISLRTWTLLDDKKTHEERIAFIAELPAVQQWVLALCDAQPPEPLSYAEWTELAALPPVERLAELAHKAGKEQWLRQLAADTHEAQQRGHEQLTLYIITRMLREAQETEDDAELQATMDLLIEQYRTYPRTYILHANTREMLGIYKGQSLQVKAELLACLVDCTIVPPAADDPALTAAITAAEKEREASEKEREELVRANLSAALRNYYSALRSEKHDALPSPLATVFARPTNPLCPTLSEDKVTDLTTAKTTLSRERIAVLADNLGIATETLETLYAYYEQMLHDAAQARYVVAVHTACGTLNLEKEKDADPRRPHYIYDTLIYQLKTYPTNTEGCDEDLLARIADDLCRYSGPLRFDRPVDLPLEEKQLLLGWLLAHKQTPPPPGTSRTTAASLTAEEVAEQRVTSAAVNKKKPPVILQPLRISTGDTGASPVTPHIAPASSIGGTPVGGATPAGSSPLKKCPPRRKTRTDTPCPSPAGTPVTTTA